MMPQTCSPLRALRHRCGGPRRSCAQPRRSSSPTPSWTLCARWLPDGGLQRARPRRPPGPPRVRRRPARAAAVRSAAGRLLYLGPPSYVEGARASTCCSASAPSARRSSAPSLAEDDPVRGPYPDDRASARTGQRRGWPRLGLHRDPPRGTGSAGQRRCPQADLTRQMRETALRVQPGQGGGRADGHRPRSEGHLLPGPLAAPGLADSGLFVARRPQAYGADLWCAPPDRRRRPRPVP